MAELGVAAEVHAGLHALVDEVEKIARRAGDGGDAEVAHEHKLAFGVAAGGRKDGASEAFSRVVDAKATSEEAVAVGDLEDVVGAEAEHGHGAHGTVAPDFDVVLRVGDDDRLAGRARGAVEADDVVHVGRAEAERILVAQVLLHHEGEEGDVLERFDVLGADPALVHAAARDRHMVVAALDRRLEAVQLQGGELLARHVVKRADGVDRGVLIVGVFEE